MGCLSSPRPAGYSKISIPAEESLERALLKQHAGFYHHRVRERVRHGNQLVAELRRHGVFVRVTELLDDDNRRRWWKQLPSSTVLRQDLEQLLAVYQLLCEQDTVNQSTLVRLARREEPVRRFAELPGIGWIRAVTFFVYVDTPFRFKSKAALWRYCGIGLKRQHSGSGPTKSRLAHGGHRRLKDVLAGAAKSAIVSADSSFADKYHYWTQEQGMHPSTARRNVARCLASTLLGLWKTGDRYDPAKVRGVGRPAAKEKYHDYNRAVRDFLGCR